AWPALKSSRWKSPTRSLIAAARIISTPGAPLGEKMAGGGVFCSDLSVFCPGGAETNPRPARGSLVAPITTSMGGGRPASSPPQRLGVEPADLDPRRDDRVHVFALRIAAAGVEDEKENRVLRPLHQLEDDRKIGRHRACFGRSDRGGVRRVPQIDVRRVMIQP